MKHLKRGAVLIGALLMTLLMSVGVFADEAWTKADVTNSSIGVSKQTTELKSLSYIADEGISLNVDNDKVSVSGKGIGTGSTVYVSNSTDTETGLANATYNKVDNGAKTGIVYFDSKKIDVRHVTSYFNIKIETGSKSTVIKVKTTVAYGDLYVYAFQMNTKHDDGAVSEYNPSYRVVNYCGNVLAKGNDLIPVRGFGTVYGINGTFTKNNLVKNSSNANVYSFDATEQGLVDVKNATQWDNYYAVTFKNLSYNPKLLDRSYTLRPYAILEDGSIMYSDDVQSTSIYDVANVLYERNAMSTKEARTFLYKHILNIVKLKNNYVNICKNMLHVLNVTDANSADYKFVNALYKDLYCYVELTQNYENAHYYDRDNFVAKTFVDRQDPNTVLLDKLNKAAETDYDTILDWINFESPKNGVEGGYVPAGVYENGKLTKDWSDLVKDGDVVVNDETLKSVSDNVNGDLQLPESIKKVESAKGSNLDTVTVPSTVEEISDDAFTEVPKVIYNGNATGAPWEADSALVKGKKIETPIYVGYNSNDKTLYFAKTANEIKNADVDLTSDNYYGNVSTINFSSYNSAPWYSINWQITKVNFLSEIKPTSCSYWFYCFTSLADIDNIQNLNTKNVTNMSYMFSYCGALTSLDVSNFDTSKVTRMDWMFYNCYILTSLDLSNFDTRKVTDMSYMLGLCNEVTSLDLSNFDTSKVTDMSSMFSGCSKLTTLDVSNFDTSKVTHMSYIFYNCSSLITLKLGIFNTSKVSSYSNIFSKINSNTILYTYSQNTKDWILNLSSSNRPSSWTTDNIKVICSKNESGHNFETITTEPTCTENGKQVKTCTYCGYKEEIVLKAGHNFEVVTNNEGNKELVCSRCNEHREYHDYTIDIISNTNYVQDNNKFTSNIKGVNNGKSSIELTLTVYETTNFNFKYKVSSESRYDKGSLTIDGVTVADAISGTSNSEQTYTKILVPGTYTITSSYMKDSSANNGDDCFYFTVECGHIWDNGTITKEPTCTEAGTKVYKCTNDDCDVTKTETIKALGHNWDNGIVTKEPTCTDTGTKICTCSRDNVTKTETIKALGHDYNDNNVCTRCNDKLENPIFVGYSSSDNTLYFASKQKEIKNAGIDLTSDNYYGDISKINFASTSAPWENNSNITQITFLSEIKPTSCSYWFYKLDGLTKINNIKNLNTCNVTDMSYMFSDCSALTSLDVSNFDTSKVTSMVVMFSDCSSLTTLDVSNFDTSKAVNMSKMFYNCSALTTLDLNNFDTSKVTNMESMFYNCSSLTALDLSNFDTSKVTNMNGMFDGCSKLTSLDLSDFDTSKVTSMRAMFTNCYGLKTINLSNFDTSNVKNMGSMFYCCSNLTSLDLSNFNTGNVTDMRYMFLACIDLTSLDVNNFDTSNVTNMSAMFEECVSLTTIDVSNFNTSKVTDMSSMFDGGFGGHNSLTTLDLSNFDTSNVTDMSNMFSKCTSLTTLDISSFNTNKVTNLSDMFSKCNSLSSLDISNFDTSNVTKMDGMFDRCSSLTSLDVSNFNTSKVTNISGMFYNCSKLTTLDVSSFDTSKVTDISGMFYNCTSLTTLDVSNFNTSNVTTMKSMFAKCLKLTHIDGLENFNTSKVTDMSLMFGASSYIGDGKIIFDNISNWDTHNVKDMTCMFYGQGAQTELDISKWNVSNCTSFNHMFCDNNKLKKLDLSKWDVSNVKTVYDMFDDCYALTTIGNVSNWNTSNMVDLGGFMNGCNNFEGSNGTLDLSGWDTSNVISMGEMFRACKKLTQIKLNNFDTSKVTDGSWTGAGSGIYYEYGNNSNEYKGMSIMFKDCPNLTSIIVGSKWSTDGKTTTNMFLNCGTDHVTIQ